MLITILIWLAVLLVLGGGVYGILRYAERERLASSLGMVLFLVKIPRERVPDTEGKGQDFKSEIGTFEQLLTNLLSLKGTFVFECAVPHVGEEIHFYLAVPKKVGDTAAKQVQGLWSGASVEPLLDDYTIFNPQGAIAAAYLSQEENYALPIRTYQEIGLDTFASVVGAFSKMNEVGEGAALQLICAPAPKNIKKNIHKFGEMLKRGEPLEKIIGHTLPLDMEEVGSALNPFGTTPEKKEKEKVVDDEAIKILEGKISKPLFQVNVRLLASAPSPFQANSILDGLAAGFEQFGSPRRNEFKIVKPRKPDKLAHEYTFRTFNSGQSLILNSEEIASFFHLPISSTETPRVKWLKTKEASPPTNVPIEGVLIGQSSFRGISKDIHITDDDRRRHIYMIGQTGTGKSTLMSNMVIDDINRGKGVALIDPHGDLVETTLGHIPKNRLDDVIYFDPSDLFQPLGLNMLDFNASRPEEKTFIVNEMQGIFNKLFPPETMGPMFEQYMRNALLLMMEDMVNEPATLVEVPRIFTDKDYRARKLVRIHNPVVIDFWEKEAVKAGGDASLANMTPYITSKFNNFISNDYMRPIIGQAKSAFNFREVMDQGKILLINLSKGKIGDINAGLLGMVFTGKLLMAALSRVDIQDPNGRRDFNLYIDEFQNFTTDSIATILSEARKYRLNLTMAHQFIAQLTEKIRDAVFGNVGSQVTFRVGVQDAEFLIKQFEPTFSQNDLINIDNFNAYVKILVNGETAKPFNIKTMPGQAGNYELVDKLKEYSRAKYGMDRQTIEEEIYKRLRE